MKVSLVVASGVHQGKVIPITGPKFIIGRDPECHLRPASQAVSKQHCAVLVRDGEVYLADFGSTNGTVLNEAVVKGEERPLRNNDLVRIGPLDFTVRVEPTPARDDGTPLPVVNAEAAAAIAAVKAAAGQPAAKTGTRDATPAPKTPTAKTPAPKPGSKESPALKTDSRPVAPTKTAEEEEHDRLAAMLLGLEDGDVPGGSTVVDVPVPDLNLAAGGAAPGDAQGATNARVDDQKKKMDQEKADTSNAASELLRKYMRRPR